MVDTTMSASPAYGGLSFPYPAVGAKAAAAALNKKGGIDGHPVQIDVCDNQANPNQSVVCGRKAKSDGDIAVIGSADFGAPEMLPVLQAEGIPYIGSEAATPAELSSPDSFNFDPAAVLAPFATAGMWQQLGCKNVVEFLVSGQSYVIPGQQAIAAADGYRLHTVTITTDQADVTAPVSTAMSMKPDCASDENDGQTAAKLLAGLRQVGFTGKFTTALGSLQPPFLKSIGKVGNGVIALSTTLVPSASDPQVLAFHDQVTAYAGSQSAAAPDLNEAAQDAWSSVQLVDRALSGTGSYTSAELLKKLPTICAVNIGNVYPSLSFCKPAAQSAALPRVFNTYWRYYLAQNGVYVPLNDQWHNLASTVPAKL